MKLQCLAHCTSELGQTTQVFSHDDMSLLSAIILPQLMLPIWVHHVYKMAHIAMLYVVIMSEGNSYVLVQSGRRECDWWCYFSAKSQV